MKPKKTAEELVQMLHDEKGIQFHLISEEQAVECFSQRNNYLRTASYRKNYPKHIAGPNAGKYIHLEFAYLTELSTLDFYLRELLLQMCIDVEHDLKVSLLRELEENPSEDGYAIVRDFLAQYPEILAAIERKTDASFTGELIEKYFAVCSVFPAQSPQAYLSTRIYDVDSNVGSGRTDWIWRIFAYVPFLCRTKSTVYTTVTPKSFESGQKFAQCLRA